MSITCCIASTVAKVEVITARVPKSWKRMRGVPVAGAVLVSTPQSVALADTRRAVAMYRKLNIPTIGLVENMSHFVCPGCGRESDLFGRGGAEKMAAEMGVPFLGAVPLSEPVRNRVAAVVDRLARA